MSLIDRRRGTSLVRHQIIPSSASMNIDVEMGRTVFIDATMPGNVNEPTNLQDGETVILVVKNAGHSITFSGWSSLNWVEGSVFDLTSEALSVIFFHKSGTSIVADTVKC